MDRSSTRLTGDSPPSESWLFAQALLGRPIPRIVPPEVKARAHRAELERLARFSSRHAQELHKLRADEAEPRRGRENLEWAAQFSKRAEDKLRAIQQREAEDRRAWHAAQQFTEAHSVVTEWNEANHPRAPKGTSIGGQWIEKGGSAGGAGTAARRSSSNQEHRPREPDPHMLELAHTWWQTKAALEQARRDIEELPHRIARERAQLGSGGRYAYVHSQNLEKAQRDLEAAKALMPELEKQLSSLEQEYHDAGYDEVAYSTFTPAETIASGKGIEDVGRAVARGGTPAGLKPTGIEFDVATAAMGGPAVLRVGKALLTRATRRAAVRTTIRRASFGHARTTNYRKTFFDAHPHTQGKVIVHHGVEQQVFHRYPGVITKSELHSLENLRGIPKGRNAKTHLKEIRKEWDAFYRQHPDSVTKEQLLQKATEIDAKYGKLFDPPVG